MRRFWKQVAVTASHDGWAVELDGRPLRTPARAPLTVRQQALAKAIAAEWQGAGDTVDARSMPMTGLANAVLDRIAPDSETFATGIARYGEADLLSYRADGPSKLVARQAEAWDPLLAWARRRYDIDFAVTQGIIFVPQPAATIERLAAAVRALDPFMLAGLSPPVTIGGSLVAGLAVLEQAVTPEAAWNAVALDECWQLEQWGSDAEAELALQNRRLDFLAGARFLDLVRS